MPGGKANPTIQLNKVRNTDPKRRAAGSGANVKRGMQLGRFGGYGNQRYPVGFSGDVDGVVWSNLAYQPYFTMTSSNAGGFGYWSHDITVRLVPMRLRLLVHTRFPVPRPLLAASRPALAACRALARTTSCSRAGSRGAHCRL